ncbi:RusA family crossover junction endodeoxyribonuclease [Streptomyces sp. NPDC058548]|uniref:RusA family crossover junction endodeoxyribonuclease n=1 Tax=Streptomyces sp. NPDC058548 TaxID=3346545 RepID=UPI00365E28D4
MSETVVRVVAVGDGTQLDCCDEDTAHVWVRVVAWSPRRAFLTGAAPFVAAAGAPAADLVGRAFLADLDLDTVPPNDDTAGERLEWPQLRLLSKIPEQSCGVLDTVVTAASLLPAGGPEWDPERARLLVRALAPGVKEATFLVLPGVPASKTRPRFSKEGRTYKTAEDTAAEQKTAWRLRQAFRQPLAGNLAVGCVFFRPDRQRIDADNMLKHICDAGNKIAWADDAQITATYAAVELDAQHPRTLVVVARHVSSLDRTDTPTPRRKAR